MEHRYDIAPCEADGVGQFGVSMRRGGRCSDGTEYDIPPSLMRSIRHVVSRARHNAWSNLE